MGLVSLLLIILGVIGVIVGFLDIIGHAVVFGAIILIVGLILIAASRGGGLRL